MKCREEKITSITPLIFMLFFLGSFARGETWYIGCVEDYYSLDDLGGLLSPFDNEAVFSLATCCSACLQAGVEVLGEKTSCVFLRVTAQFFRCTGRGHLTSTYSWCQSVIYAYNEKWQRERFQFAGIQGESVCKCSNSNSLLSVTEDQCNYYCESGSTQLLCGGDGTLSVYSVRGPYLHTLELGKTQSTVQQDTSVLFEAKAYLAREPQEDDDLPNQSNSNSFDSVDFVWFVGKSEWSATTLPSSNETIQASLVHTFLEEGEWTVGVRVNNSVSSLSASTNVTVVRPLPFDLQVILHPEQSDIPSCIPVHDDKPLDFYATAVFVREEVLFQASLAMGINLTFQWSFSDDGSNSSRAPYMHSLCKGIACLQDSQVHTFMNEGVFSIVINVSNSLGSIEQTLYVIVLNRDITNLAVSLADPASPIRTLNFTTDFIITMKTAVRAELVLEIDFGDGSVYTHSLRDINDTFILGGEQNVAHLHLTASYGEGCELLVSLDHTYAVAGVFQPTVTIHSVIISNVTTRATLPETLTIQRMLTDVAIECRGVYSTNESAILGVIVPVRTANISCAWIIYYTNVTLGRSALCDFMFTFAQAGNYVLELTVQNLVSQVAVNRTVVVQDVITGLQLEAKTHALIQTGLDVSLLAFVTGGSGVNFRWEFSDALNNFIHVAELESSMYPAASAVNHTFAASGMYNVSVTAFNLVSLLEANLPDGFVVQDPVQGLRLPPLTSTLLYNATVIEAEVIRGSHLDFYLDYGNGLVSPHIEPTQNGLYTLRHQFPTAVAYQVTVVVYNGISSENDTMWVVVENDIGTVSVSVYHTQEQHAILVANIDGAVPNRTDVRYTWEVGGMIHMSATPLAKISNITINVLPVHLKLENQVVVQELETDVVIPNNEVRILHPDYATIGQLVLFSVQFTSEMLWNFTVDTGDPNSRPFSAAINSTQFNWTHSYFKPGVYLVKLTCASHGEEMEVISALSIQESLTSLSLDGPLISKFIWPISYQVWEVVPQSGSDVLYSWSVVMKTSSGDNFAQDVSTSIQRAADHSRMPLSFNLPGEYNVTVIASNALSTSTVTMVTTLEEPISSVALNIEAVLIGSTSYLEIAVESGTSLQLAIDFGDGNTLHTTLLEEVLSQSEITLTRLTTMLVLYQVPWIYTALGEYLCTVKVLNQVSEVTVSAVTVVEEKIAGLRLASESGPIVRMGETVTMVATVDSGNNVVFTWFFERFGEPHVESFNNMSTATYNFQYPGTFFVNVSVHNRIQREPIIAYYSESFIVQNPIIADRLNVQVEMFPVVGNWLGAPLLGGYSTDPVSFMAFCIGSHVVFLIDYGDGSVEEMETGSVNVFSEGFGSHVYTQEGSYTITVHAQNYFGNVSRTLPDHFYVQVPPSLCCYKPYHVFAFGDATNLTVELEGGSHVSFNWSMGDQTNYLFHGESVSHKYLYEGDFFVTVVAFNKVARAEMSFTVIIQNKIQGVQVNVNQHPFQVRTPIEFHAVTIPTRVHEYIWDMGDGNHITKSITRHEYTYDSPGTYFVTVLAKNYISNATSMPVELAIQSPIHRLSVNLESATLVNQTIEIKTSMYSGSDLVFQWDFGDSSDVVVGTDAYVFYAYNRTGEYIITVFASNDISNATASSHVFVLQDRLCKPPALRFVGGSLRKTNFSDDIKVETTIGVDCELTDVVLFEWTIRDSNKSVVSLNPLYSSLDRRTAFIKRRKLSYGSYTLTLVVSLNGTIVYSKDSITVTVVPTPLVAILDGGTSRVVSNDSYIVINGSGSYSLDEPDYSDLSFTWSCYQLVTPSAQCFSNRDLRVMSNRSSLTFHTDALRLNETTAFVFVLKVNQQGHQTASTSQVIYVRYNNPVRVMVECTSCMNGIVNRNDALTLKAHCKEHCDNTSYTWKLYEIQGDDETVGRDYDYRCKLIPAVYPVPVLSSTSLPPQTNETNETDDELYDGISEDWPGNGYVDASIGEEPIDDIQTSFEEMSLAEEMPGEIPGSNPEETQDQTDNVTVMEEIEATTIVYETVTVEDKPISTGSTPFRLTNSSMEDTTNSSQYVHTTGDIGPESYEELSIFEGSIDEMSYEEGTELDASIGEEPIDDIQTSFEEMSMAEEMPGEIPGSNSEETQDQTDNVTVIKEIEATTIVYETVTVEDKPISTGSTPFRLTNSPMEDTTNSSQYVHTDVTGTTSYVNEEYVDQYFEEDVGGQPTVADYTGDIEPGSYEELSIFEGSIDEMSYEEGTGSQYSPERPSDPGDGASGVSTVQPGEEVYNPDTPKPGEHIVDQNKNEYHLQDEDTLMGLHGQSLTIRRDLLDEGLTYAVAVTVNSVGVGEGEATQYLFVNDAPHHGNCYITPSEGNELDQIFRANCHEWVDDNDIMPLRMELSYRLSDSDPQTVLYYGMNQAINFQLPAGYAHNNRKVRVNIAIEDSRGGRASVCSIDVRVTPKLFGPGESKEEFLYNATVPAGSKLLEFVHNGDHNKVYIHIVTFANALNLLEPLISNDMTHTHTGQHVLTTDDHHAVSKIHLLELRRAIRQALLVACGRLPMRDGVEIKQYAAAMAQSTAVLSELSHEAISVAAQILDAFTVATLYCVQEDNFEISRDMLMLVAITSSNMLDAMSLKHTRDMSADVKKKTIDKIMSTLSKILKTQLNIQEKDGTPFSVDTATMKILGARLSSFAGQQYKNSYTTVILPQSMTSQFMRQNEDKMAHDHRPCIDIEVLSFLQNPYSWGTGGDRVTSGATSVEIFTCDNQKLEVNNLPEEDGVIMEFYHTCNHDKELLCNHTFTTTFMSVHQFNVTDLNKKQTFHVILEMTSLGRMLPVRVLLRKGYEPTPYEYDNKWIYSTDKTKFDIFLHPGSFNETGVYYLALMDDVFDKDVYRGDVAKKRPYTLQMWWGDCLYWQSLSDEWLRGGCTALPTSTFEMTRCQCNHLSTFAISFHPVLTTAKFVNLLMFLRPNENAVPYSFVAALCGVYVVLFIYCCLADKHDEKKQGRIYLKDNQTSDQQYYELTVETGFRTGAGTTARVSIVLHGDEGHSETKELICDDGRPLFERNSRDRFIVSVPESLGIVHKVLVWHNNGGISPSWYLSRIAVRDLITGQKWYFICDRWFAVEEDDGKIEREFDALEEGVGFQKAFWAKGAQYFADYYLWSSIFTRPPYSVFTRVQRLTCCLSISMSFLCICILHYYIMRDEDLELGLLDVSSERVVVGVIVALLAVPINLPIIMLFRRSKPNYVPVKPEILSGEKASEIYYCNSEVDEKKILHDDNWDSGMMEQTAITLQNLQAWAKRKWKHRHKSSAFPQNQVTPIEMKGPASESTDQYISDQQSIFDFGSISSFGDFRDVSDSGLSSSYNRSLSSYMHTYLPHHKRVTSPKIWMPHSFLYIAWSLCFGIIVFSAVTTSILGYRLNKTIAVYWTHSVYFSFLQCIFVTQPLVMLILTIVKSWCHRNNLHIFDHYDDNIDVIDRRSLHRSRLDLYENDLQKGIAARQRSRYLRFARPPQAKDLHYAKERMLKEKNMSAILKDGILFTIVFVCLLWMAYGKDLKDHHPVNTAIVNVFVKTPHPFTSISTKEDLWDWLQHDMLEPLYWDEWYNGQQVQEEKGTVMNGGSTLIGKASLRQLRVRPETCRIAPEVRHLFPYCHGGFSPQTQSRLPFGPGSLWNYMSKNELHRANKWGMFASYEGDGYAISLNTSRVDAAEQISQLKANTWIDSQTRLVILEFTLYNAPTNLFTSVALLAEIPGTGAVYPFPKIESVLLYRYETAYDYFIICCEMIFLLLVAVSAKAEVHKAITLKAMYFKSTWSWLEMGTLIISLTYFAMYVTRFIFVEEVVHRLHSTYLEEFVDVSSLAYWDQCLRDLIGCMLFLIGIKLLHLWRFNRTVAKFCMVIDGAIRELLLFALYYVLLESAFACFGVLVLGANYYHMKHLFAALQVLSSSAVGHVPTDKHRDMQFPVWWPLYSMLHTICVLVLLSGLIKAVLCHSYKKTKNYKVDQLRAGELFKFFWDHFLAIFGIFKSKDSNNMGKNTLPPEFTMAEIEYQVDELLFKMNAMSHEHSMPDKCRGYLNDSDGTHGLIDDSISYSSSDMHSFDQVRLDERVQKIETNFYSANPELRELLDGFCLIDEDREKQLRSQLELEIFRQLQLSRQEESHQVETIDSGRDTQSVSDQGASDALHTPRRGPLLPVEGHNLGLLDMPVSSLASANPLTDGVKHAWGLESQKSSSTPDSISLDNLANDNLEEKQAQEMKSAFFKQLSPELSQTEGSGGEHASRGHVPNKLRVLPGDCNERSAPKCQDFVKDYTASASYDNTISMEGFPLPNTLESLSSSSDESQKLSPRRKRKGKVDSGRRLRKTRSQGKGKGHGRCDDDDAAYMNPGYSSDSDEYIPVISMGPIKYLR